jgi:hypothetical protein
VSLRRFHPNAEIELYLSKKSDNNATWGIEEQDFQKKSSGKCYLDELRHLNIKVIEKDLFPTYAPNYQSDFFRWWWLYHNGGFYLDTDQIILRDFNELPLEADLIYSMYRAKSCGLYSPVGVIGAKKGCPIVKQIMDEMGGLYNPKDYNSIGPFMFRDLFLKNRDRWEREHVVYNAPPNWFYPVAESYMVNSLYDSELHFAQESFAVHWFGGHPNSQEFNRTLTEESILKNKDTISMLARPLMKYREGTKND